MYTPPLQHQLVQAHIRELHRSRHASSTPPITTNERIAARHRRAAQLSASLVRSIERLVGHPGPAAPAF